MDRSPDQGNRTEEEIKHKKAETDDKMGSIIYGTDESELILQPHFHFRY